MSASRYEVIIVGGGHNGLVAAVYLGSARPRQTALFYLTGAVLVSLIMGIVLLLALRSAGLNHPHQHAPRYGLRLGLGIVLLSSGPVSLSCGFVFALRFPGAVGDTLLVLAAGSAVLGELISTVAMRGLLDHVGELPPPDAPRSESQLAPASKPSLGDAPPDSVPDSGRDSQTEEAAPT